MTINAQDITVRYGAGGVLEPLLTNTALIAEAGAYNYIDSPVITSAPSASTLFYVDPAQPNDSGNGLTPGTAKQFINSAIALTGPGDIVELQDGVYPDVSGNQIGDSLLNANPGTPGSYTVIRAQTDGGVEISAPLGVDFEPTGNVYYEFQGLKWKSSYGKFIGSQFVKYLRCSFSGGPPGGNTVNAAVSSHQLMEDCWFYGPGGRIGLIMFNSTDIVLRRCVVRRDGGWGFGSFTKQEPELSLSVYPNDGNPNANIMVQNCIVVDSDTFGPPEGIEWAPNFTNNTHGVGAANSFHKGCICVNCKGTAFGVEGSGSFGALFYDDCVSINNEAGFLSNISGQQTTIDRFLAINSGAGAANFFAGTQTMKNGVVADNANWGFGSGGITPSFNNCFNNGPGGSPSCGANSQTYDPELNGLRHPVRIEAGGALLTDGEGGGQIGATILKKRGVSGTMYGDSGYDDLTTDDLWPWPNEERIRNDFREVTPVSGQVFDGKRGFCADGVDSFGRSHTLSRYIWQSLGYEVPNELGLRDAPGWLNGKYSTTLVPGTYNCADGSVRCVGSGHEHATIQAAVNLAQPGDVILVHDGTYAGFEVSTSGTVGNEILITANGNNVTVNSSAAGRNDNIYVSDSDYVIIEGFNVINATTYGISTHDASATSPMQGVQFRYNTVSNSGSTNIYMSNAANSLILGNTAFDSVASHGIYLTNAGSDDCEVIGNTANNNFLNGIHFNGDLSGGGDGLHTGLTVSDNIIHNNLANGIDGDGVHDSDFINNLIYENGRHAIRIFQIDASAGASNLTFVNNLMADNASAGIKLTQDIGGHTFFHNIVVGEGEEAIYVESASINSDYNVFTSGATFQGGAASLFRGSNSIDSTSGALFTNAAADDYSQAVGSPAIDFGVLSFNGINAPLNDITGLPRSSVDAGAYEN